MCSVNHRSKVGFNFNLYINKFPDGNTYEIFGVNKQLYTKLVNSDKQLRFARRKIFGSCVYRKAKSGVKEAYFVTAQLLLVFIILYYIYIMKNLTSAFFVLTISFLVFPFSNSISQTDSTSTPSVVSDHVGNFYIIQTVDDIEYLGKVIKDDGREVWVVDERLGLVVLPKHSISEMIRLDVDTDLIVKNYVPEGAFTTRNIFTANAFPIKKGKHYAMFNLFGPEAHFAVNDKFNLGVMSTWIASPISLVTKYSFSEEEAPIKVALGGLLGNSGYLDLFATSGGIGFITFTTGTRQNNVSLSLGYGFMSNSIDYLEAGEYTIIDYGTYYPNYNWEQTIINYNDVDLTTGKQIVSGPILSLAFSLKIGRNSSIVFDSMFGSFSQTSSPRTEVTNTSEGTVVPNMNGYYSYNLTVGTSAVVDDKYKAALFMPGVRIQRSDSKAFQFAIAGIAFTENGELNAFPIPMVTWFRGFN